MTSPISRLVDVMARLRDPKNGCPWDLKQSFATIVPYTIEEAHEVAAAIADEDWPALRDELGDLLFQVIFYAQLAMEKGFFDFDAIVEGVVDKMVRRHPHVFGGERIDTAKAQSHAWETHKAMERQAKAAAENKRSGALDGVARGLPALTRAAKLQARAAAKGFDWPDTAQVLDKVDEEVAEIHEEIGADGSPERLAEEIGDLLFASVNLARHLGIDAEAALRGGNAKFERRFRRIEELLTEQGRTPDDASLEEMESLWIQSKAEERA